MSSFIVEPGLIAEAVNGLANLTHATNNDKAWALCQRKCNLWAKLNLDAYKGRYRQDGGEPQRVRFHFVPIGLSGKVAASFALSCLIYQCSEPPVMELQDFADMEKDLKRLNADIVAQLAKDQGLKWGQLLRKFEVAQTDGANWMGLQN